MNYPAGPNAWNGQPMAVQPANDYFQPSPATGSPVKLTAESLNWILKQCTLGLTTSVTSLAALRALPVPSGSQSVQLTPENTGQVMGGGFAADTYVPAIGGEYYYDAAYNVVDNSSTAIRPTAIGSTSPGMWRLKGGPLFTVYEQYADIAQFSGPVFSASLNANGTAQFATSLSLAFGIGLNTGSSAGSLYLNDIIDMRASISVSLSGGGTFGGDFTSYFTRNGTKVGAAVNLLGDWTTGTVVQQELACQYVVTAADIAAGSLSLSASSTLASVSGSSPLFIGGIQNYKFTIRRP
jgi:hypothetical protein